VDNLFRQQLGYPQRMQSLAQPWTVKPQPDSGNTLSLRFKISSEIALNGSLSESGAKPTSTADTPPADELFLALEALENTEITWNGSIVNPKAEGYYVDRSIKKVRLPSLILGDNELILKVKFEQRTNIENCFILGKFGVKLAGKFAKLTTYPKELPFGDISKMGLPFYGGNVTYKCRIYSHGKPLLLESTYFRAPLLTVKVNGKEIGPIAYAPYIIDLGHLPEGWHELDITAYGNRVNTFGTLHNSDEKLRWFGPNAWRTTDATWSYEYVTRPVGVLKSPRIATGDK